MTTLKEWAARNTTPEQRARRDRQLAAALVRDAQRKAELAKPYTESYARGVAEQQRLVAESLERQRQLKERRQGGTPDAVEVQKKFVEDSTCVCEDNTSSLVVDRRNLNRVDERGDDVGIVEVANFGDFELSGNAVRDQRIDGRAVDQFRPVRHNDLVFGSADAVHAVEDTELRCATCDCTNVTLGVRAEIDENGEPHDDEGGWCWDCGAFVEVVEIEIPGGGDLADAETEEWFERFAEVA